MMQEEEDEVDEEEGPPKPLHRGPSLHRSTSQLTHDTHKSLGGLAAASIRSV